MMKPLLILLILVGCRPSETPAQLAAQRAREIGNMISSWCSPGGVKCWLNYSNVLEIARTREGNIVACEPL